METSEKTQTFILQDQLETEKAIDLVKTTFSQLLCRQLDLFSVVAPLIVTEETGINDDLNGIERPVHVTYKGYALSKGQCGPVTGKMETLQAFTTWRKTG
jgi:aspartate--ammonia ligase